MDGHTYIKERQKLWAIRRGLELQGSKGEQGERAYTSSADANLFQPLSEQAQRCYEQGDGGELGTGKFPGKIQAVHSSAALATNVFDYWMSGQDPSPILRSLGLRTSGNPAIELETKFPIGSSHRRPPNLDAAIRYRGRSEINTVAIECKLTEAYGNRGHGGLKPTYLDEGDLWSGLRHLKRFAQTLSPDDTSTQHLHPAQLIKHTLGLTNTCGTGKFKLIYLWYDVPSEDGDRHREELKAFAEIAGQDGVAFSSMTYQELILKLARYARDRHQPYVDYLCERYL